MRTASSPGGLHSRGNPESPQEPSRFFGDAWARLSAWAPEHDQQARRAASAVTAYFRSLDARRAIVRDHRAPAGSREAADRTLMAARHAAIYALEPVVLAGLERRELTWIAPSAVVPGSSAAADVVAWGFVRLVLRLLAVDGPREICVCEACTLVFRPARKAQSRYCRLCAKRPAAPPLGAGHPPIQRAGDRATVRAPILAPPGSRIVVGWRNVTVGKCAECGEPFSGRADTVTCSAGCRKRRARRAA